ncbi:hypothetical protein EMCRGX_G009814 [Ephydatia muelleri]
MENILQGIPDVLVYLDDILVAGSSEAEHMQFLEMVMTKLENAGMRFKENVLQLRSFLGLVNYYGKFLHKLADTLAPPSPPAASEA